MKSIKKPKKCRKKIKMKKKFKFQMMFIVEQCLLGFVDTCMIQHAHVCSVFNILIIWVHEACTMLDFPAFEFPSNYCINVEKKQDTCI